MTGPKSYFPTQGRALLGNGYLIVPIKPGHKRPALASWQHARLGAGDLSSYPGHGVGVLCGQGAHPVAAIDVDTTDAQLAQRFVDWCQEHLGATCERVGAAPKILLPYRAAEAGWGKAISTAFSTAWVQGPDGRWYSEGWAEVVRSGKRMLTSTGQIHRVEVLGRGQQFVAYHVHPDTGRPYEWTDLLGGMEHVRADDLPVLTEDQVRQALLAFDAMAAELAGLQPHPTGPAAGSAPAAPKERTPADEADFFGRVNEAALDGLQAWVPALFPAAREYMGGFRVSSADLHRDLEEDLSIVPEGIVDFGVADMGDERQGKRTPIDLVLEWAPRMLDDPLDAPASPFEAALWLCEMLDVAREDLGFGLRRQRERQERLGKKRDALNQAKGKIAACEDSIELINEVAAQVGELADDMALRAELAGLLRQRFKELTGTLLPVADVRTAMAGGRKGPVLNRAKRQMTEFGNAERMLDHFGEGLMFVPEIAAWHTWDGKCWRNAPQVLLEHLAKETVRALADESKTIENDDERVAFFKFCAVSQRAMMVRNMVALASSDPRVVVPVSELDKHNHLLGVGNGAVDLQTGELLPPEREHWITTITPIEYSPTARAPLFEQTVRDVFHGDDEMVAFFQRVVGYSILGQPKEDVMVIPYGSGSNGKSTVLGAIRYALGEHARTANADTFLATGGAGNSAGAAREDILRLRGARFVYVGEPDEGSELREGLIKSMTGGDPMPARGLWSKVTVEVVPTWVAFMPTNHRPIVKGDDHAIWRRLLPVPFTRNFDKDDRVKKDPQRAEKLEREAAGILRWCIDGALAYQRDGLNPPAKVRAAHDEYRQDMDLLAEWLDTCCEVGPSFVASNSELWNSWEYFARSRGELRFIPSSKSLGRRLLSRGFAAARYSHGLRGRGFLGLRVRDGLDD